MVNIGYDPVETYEHLKGLGAKGLSFLLPDSNYLERPPLQEASPSETPYGDWLAAVFDRWIDEPRDRRMGIGLFQRIMSLLLGQEVGSDNLGNDAVEVLVIETNGDIEAVDMLKICGESFTKGKANVQTTEFDEALATPLAALFNQSHQRLPHTCMACPVNSVCGGGSLHHRYSTIGGFNNPSVYCKDLMRIITHIQNRICERLPEALLQETGIAPLTYTEARHLLNEALQHIEAPTYAHELEGY